MTVARPSFLGIDCGTSSTKAILVDATSGAVIGSGSAEHGLDARPDGTREQDPLAWISAATTAIRAALATTPGATLRGMAVSGQQHGLVVLDAADRPMRPAKLWNDTTTAAESSLLSDALGGPEAAIAFIGNRFLPSYTAPKLLWLRRHEPEIFRGARRFCLPHDYLNLWLTGAFVTEPGDASGTAYVDVRTRRYADAVLAAIDAERDWAQALPPIIASRSIVGELRAEAASALGLPPGLPVSAGGGDNMCAAIGVGAVEAGPVVVSLGTSMTAFTHRDEPAIDPLGEVSAFCDSTGGWLPLACTLNGTGAVDRAREWLGSTAPTVDAALAASPAGARGLTFLPYLSGERTPDLPHARGTVSGLRLDTEPADLIRAAVEGVTDGLVVGLEALGRTGVSPKRLIAVGGGANSDAWCQLLADIAGLPVERTSDIEAAAIGAARQVRWVVDDVAPSASASVATWEPRSSGAYDEVRQRLAVARTAAAGPVSPPR